MELLLCFTVIGSSVGFSLIGFSLGSTVIGSSLSPQGFLQGPQIILLDHQCSFSAMSLFFYQIVLLLFFNQKHTFCFAIIISSKTISLTYFNNFDKTGSEKNIIKIKNKKKYVESICHQFPDL